MSSGAASMWLRDQDDKTKKLFSDPSITWEALEEAMKANVAAKNFRMGGYGLSKAGLTALTMIQVKLHVQFLRLHWPSTKQDKSMDYL